MAKSEAKIDMENAVIEAFYQMASESVSTDNFEKLEDVIRQISATRGLGDFRFFPRDD